MSQSHEQMQDCVIERFRVKPQIRKKFDSAVIAAMSQSLQDVGQLQPVRGQLRADGFIDLTDGELRLRAAQAAGFTKLKVILEGKDLSEGELVHRQLAANCHRDNLKPVEKANAVERLMKETGWSATQAAAKLGVSVAAISRLLSLLKLPVELLRKVDEGAIAESAAAELARIEDPATRAELAARLASGELTRDAVSGIRKRKVQSTTNPAGKTTRVTAMLGSGRSVSIAAPALQSLDVLIALLEELLAKARKVRPQGVEIRTFIKMLNDQAKRDTGPREACHV